MLNRDFFKDLPGCVCALLDDMAAKYKNEEWLPKAWDEYRQHILHSKMDDMKMPGAVFNKYIKPEEKK